MKKEFLDIMSEVLWFSTDFFHKEGFNQMLPIILSPITDPLGPDPGSTVIKTGEIEYLGQKLSLTQSMILHKQIALSKGLKKLFILSPNVRLEDPKRKSTGKHLFEFTQLDFEIKGAKMDDVFKLMEKYIISLMKDLKKKGLLRKGISIYKSPFPKIHTKDLIAEFGEDWEIKASKSKSTPFWAISHKREFYDKKHPSIKGDYLNYDLVYPEGFGEALSGAEREFEYDALIKRISDDKLPKSKYKSYLELAKKGELVPSAGGGFGIERLVRFLTGVKHVKEVQLFKRVPGEKVIF